MRFSKGDKVPEWLFHCTDESYAEFGIDGELEDQGDYVKMKLDRIPVGHECGIYVYNPDGSKPKQLKPINCYYPKSINAIDLFRLGDE